MAFSVSPATALNPWLQILAALEMKVIRQSFRDVAQAVEV